MLIFLKRMIDNKSRTYQPGQTVPEGFSTPAGLAEMIKVGDIGESPVEGEQCPEDTGDGEQKQEVPNGLLSFEQAAEYLQSENIEIQDFGFDESTFEPVALKDLKKAVAKFKKEKSKQAGE